jgi:hypothetical protein
MKEQGKEGIAMGRNSTAGEFRRAWLLEIKPYFEAEMDYLREHGREAGCDEDFIHRIKGFHSRMEDVVFAEDEEGLREFILTMGRYLRFKKGFLVPGPQRFFAA